jgi:uncharacterized protein (DUF2267 family)
MILNSFGINFKPNYREIYQQNHSFIEEIIKLKRISDNHQQFNVYYNVIMQE